MSTQNSAEAGSLPQQIFEPVKSSDNTPNNEAQTTFLNAFHNANSLEELHLALEGLAQTGYVFVSTKRSGENQIEVQRPASGLLESFRKILRNIDTKNWASVTEQLGDPSISYIIRSRVALLLEPRDSQKEPILQTTKPSKNEDLQPVTEYESVLKELQDLQVITFADLLEVVGLAEQFVPNRDNRSQLENIIFILNKLSGGVQLNADGGVFQINAGLLKRDLFALALDESKPADYFTENFSDYQIFLIIPELRKIIAEQSPLGKKRLAEVNAALTKAKRGEQGNFLKTLYDGLRKFF